MLPQGADAVKETFGDWAVECRIVGDRRICSAGQYQYDSQQRAVVFRVEIQPPTNGDYAATLTMPLGLNLSEGVRLTIGDLAAEHRGNFATCLPVGCVVPFKFTRSSVELMKTAKAMIVSGEAFSGDGHLKFAVSLKGFAAAIERLGALQQ